MNQISSDTLTIIIMNHRIKNATCNVNSFFSFFCCQPTYGVFSRQAPWTTLRKLEPVRDENSFITVTNIDFVHQFVILALCD